MQRLKGLFGYSGYIGIGKRIVFLEGEESSADSRIYRELFPETVGEIKWAPTGGARTGELLHRKLTDLLDEVSGYAEFYVIRDRDYQTDAEVTEKIERFGGRLHILERHEIENYLLDSPSSISQAFDDLGVSLSESDVEAALLKIAHDITGMVLRDMIAYRLNRHLNPYPFALGKFMNNEPQARSEDGTWNSDWVKRLETRLCDLGSEINKKINEAVDPKTLATVINTCKADIDNALVSDGWKTLFPGKEIVERLAHKYGIKPVGSLRNAIIRHMEPPDELQRVVVTISDGGRLGVDTS